MDTRLLWLAVAAFVGSTEGGLIAGLLPGMSRDMGVTAGQAGQVVVGYSLGYAIGPPLLSVFLGHVGRRRILGWAEFLLGVTALLIAVSPFFLWLVGARTLLSIAAGTFTGTALAVAAAIAPQGQRGRALQVVATGQALAVLVGVPLGAFVAERFSWRVDYAIIGAAAVAASLALLIKLPRGMQGDTQTIAQRVAVMRNRGVPTALLTTLLFMVGAYPVIVFIGAAMDEMGVSHTMLPLVLLANGIGAIAASMSAGRLSDRFGTWATIAGSTLVLLIAIGLFALLPMMPVGGRLAALLGVMGAIGYVGWGYWIAHCSAIADLAPNSVPLAISLNLTSLNLGVAIAAAVGGVIVDRMGALALAPASVPFVVAALVLSLRDRKRAAF